MDVGVNVQRILRVVKTGKRLHPTLRKSAKNGTSESFHPVRRGEACLPLKPIRV
jgi:hypothetical protein